MACRMPPCVNGSLGRTPDMSWVKKLTCNRAGRPLRTVTMTVDSSAAPTRVGAATTKQVATRSATTAAGRVSAVRPA